MHSCDGVPPINKIWSYFDITSLDAMCEHAKANGYHIRTGQHHSLGWFHRPCIADVESSTATLASPSRLSRRRKTRRLRTKESRGVASLPRVDSNVGNRAYRRRPIRNPLSIIVNLTRLAIWSIFLDICSNYMFNLSSGVGRHHVGRKLCNQERHSIM